MRYWSCLQRQVSSNHSPAAANHQRDLQHHVVSCVHAATVLPWYPVTASHVPFRHVLWRPTPWRLCRHLLVSSFAFLPPIAPPMPPRRLQSPPRFRHPKFSTEFWDMRYVTQLTERSPRIPQHGADELLGQSWKDPRHVKFGEPVEVTRPCDFSKLER